MKKKINYMKQKDLKGIINSNLENGINRSEFEDSIKTLYKIVLPEHELPKTFIYISSFKVFQGLVNASLTYFSGDIRETHEKIESSLYLIKDSLRKSKLDYSQLKYNHLPQEFNTFFYDKFSHYQGYFNFCHKLWACYIQKLSTKENKTELEEVYFKLLKSCSIFFISNNLEVYVLDFPEFISMSNSHKRYTKNSRERFHSVTGPSIRFRDGSEYYLISGIELSSEIFESVRNRTLKFEDFLKISNEEEKSAVLLMYQELHGESAAYQFTSESLKEVDSYFHKTGDKTLCYTLFKGKLGPNRMEVANVRCYCPSTDRMFFLGVNSRNTNAKDAIASLYRIPYLLRPHIKYINRQGERFTTVLTDEGNEIRKTMTEYDLKNLSTISGDDYFRLMKYEY